MYGLLEAGTMLLYSFIIGAALVLGVLGILLPIFVLQIKNRATSINDNVKRILTLIELNVKDGG